MKLKVYANNIFSYFRQLDFEIINFLESLDLIRVSRYNVTIFLVRILKLFEN